MFIGKGNKTEKCAIHFHIWYAQIPGLHNVNLGYTFAPGTQAIERDLQLVIKYTRIDEHRRRRSYEMS
jgi:hypothetical protein